MKEGVKKILQLFTKGANQSRNPELSALQEGQFYEAQNRRNTSTDGDLDASVSIRGESELYNYETELLSLQSSSAGYRNIGKKSVRNHLISFWASTVSGNYPFIAIDGDIVCYSEKLLLTYDHLLQIDKNESCAGGEVYITDFNVEPMIFNVQDLIDSIGTSTYFSGFNPAQYSVNLDRPINVPVFVSLVNLGIGSGGGVNVGKNSYAIQYVDSDGNTTPWSIPTPLIPIPVQDIDGSDIYPGTLVRGDTSGTQSPFGVKIRFRITNFDNYESIRIRRASFSTGQAIGVPPVVEYISLSYALDEQEISVYDFTDKEGLDWITLDSEDQYETLLAVEKAKSIRYHDNRLVLMNVSYFDREFDSFEFLESGDGNIAYPFIHQLGEDEDSREGYNDIYEHTYNQSNMRGEKYGYAAVAFDGFGINTFASPLVKTAGVTGQDFSNYQFPNRRTEVSADTYNISKLRWRGLPTGTTNENTVGYVHEAFDLGDTNNIGKQKTSDGLVTIGNGIHSPLTPVKPSDTDLLGHNRRVTDGVYTDASGSDTTYNPSGFAPRYYSMGLAVEGVDTSSLPSWVKGFSVCRTEPARRVVAQGIGIYRLITGDAKIGTDDPCTKDRDRIWFYSDDIAQGFAPVPGVNYKLQFVSPLGFFTECYHGDYRLLENDRSLDLISYARLIYNNYNINTGVNDWSGNTAWHTEFGRWRNLQYPTPFLVGGSVDADAKLFDITSFNSAFYGTTGRSVYFDIGLAENIYNYGVNGSLADVNDSDNMNFGEPWYIVNIIAEGADIVDNNINEFTFTGHFQKIESVVGKIDDSSLSFQLVDERWEDCIPNPYYVAPNEYSFIYVRDPLTSYDKAWVNISSLLPAQQTLIISTIETNGYIDLFGPDGVVIQVYGVYWHETINYHNHRIYFEKPASSTADSSVFIPGDSSLIIVKYDPRFPIKVMGGDVIIGESVFAPIDGKSKSTGGIEEQFLMNTGWPYPKWKMNDNYDILKDADSGSMQTNNSVRSEYIRQLLVMFTSENRCDIPLLWGFDGTPPNSNNVNTGTASARRTFPSTNYVLRPQQWNLNYSKNFVYNNGAIRNEYLYDFPQEFLSWGYGGFWFNQLTNVDYSASLLDPMFVTKPTVGYEAQNDFCSRIIWSKRRNINTQDAPGLKTFPSLQYFDIEDRQGGIKYAWDVESGKGINLYAITNHGICLLITNKEILSDISGGQLGAISTGEGLVQGEYWLVKDNGIPDEWWRSVSEYQKALMFANPEGVYVLFNNTINDISQKGYWPKLKSIFAGVQSGYNTKMFSVINRQYREYWLHIDEECRTVIFDNENNVQLLQVADPLYLWQVAVLSGDKLCLSKGEGLTGNKLLLPSFFNEGEYVVLTNNGPSDIEIVSSAGGLVTVLGVGQSKSFTATSTFWTVADNTNFGSTSVFSFGSYSGREKEDWQGYFTYKGDMAESDDTGTFLFKNLSVYETDIGYTINDVPIESFIIGLANASETKDAAIEKEFVHIHANGDKPSSIQFAIDYDSLPECTIIEADLRNYGGWTNYIPRNETTLDRIQGRKLFYKIIWDNSQDDRLISVILSYDEINIY